MNEADEEVDLRPAKGCRSQACHANLVFAVTMSGTQASRGVMQRRRECTSVSQTVQFNRERAGV